MKDNKKVDVKCCWCGLSDKYKVGSFDDFMCPYCGNKTCKECGVVVGK